MRETDISAAEVSIPFTRRDRIPRSRLPPGCSRDSAHSHQTFPSCFMLLRSTAPTLNAHPCPDWATHWPAWLGEQNIKVDTLQHCDCLDIVTCCWGREAERLDDMRKQCISEHFYRQRVRILIEGVRDPAWPADRACSRAAAESAPESRHRQPTRWPPLIDAFPGSDSGDVERGCALHISLSTFPFPPLN